MSIVSTKRTKKVIPLCQICDEVFNKSTRILVNCPYCDYETCRKCCETYALIESAVKCINPECGKEWTRKHIREIFTLVFINGPLKEHREKVLFDKERALLPATQPIIEGKILAKKLESEISNIQKQVTELNRQVNILYQEKTRALNRRTHSNERSAFIRACPDESCRGFLSTQWKCGICEKWVCPDCHIVKGYTRDAEHTCNPDDIATAKLISSDTKPCPQCRTGIFKIDGCFAENVPILLFDGSTKMSQDIQIGDELIGDDGNIRIVLNTVCGTDELYEVSQNRGMTYIVNSKHKMVLKYCSDDSSSSEIEIFVNDYMCLDEIIKSRLYGYKVEYPDKNHQITSITIKSIGIGKYYGWEVDNNHRFLLNDFTVVRNCDQMWCTQCHTAFSWRTGNIETNIHNPHYYEWQRRNGVAPRNPNDIICGRNMDHYLYQSFYRIINSYYAGCENYRIVLRNIEKIIQNSVHLLQVERPATINYERRNENLRVQYLMKEITEEEMRNILQRDDKKYHRNQELAEVYTLLVNTVTDILYRFHDELDKNKLNSRISNRIIDTTILNEIDLIIDYANECLTDISYTYSCSRLIIASNMALLRGNNVSKYLQEKSKTNVTVNNNDAITNRFI